MYMDFEDYFTYKMHRKSGNKDRGEKYSNVGQNWEIQVLQGFWEIWYAHGDSTSTDEQIEGCFKTTEIFYNMYKLCRASATSHIIETASVVGAAAQ